ncbi:MAG TPA: hypothetical protein VGM74_09645, partial [Burkholderiaceae bacterium]
MTDTTTDTTSGARPDQPITTRAEFQAALRQGFAEAAAAGSRELWLADPDFADWPLGERDVIEHLSQWVSSSRRLTLLANGFDEVARRHPRWVAWRRTWSHVVSCRINTELEADAMPTLLIAAGTITVRLIDIEHHRGHISRGRAAELRCKEMF